MESHARDLCAINGMQLLYTADERLNDIRLSLEQRKNIYLIFKEALNNALKYSQASAITISIVQNNGQLKLEVADNGKGFQSNGSVRGNGLKNMELRAKEIHASLLIGSVPNKGTSVQLNCPV